MTTAIIEDVTHSIEPTIINEESVFRKSSSRGL